MQPLETRERKVILIGLLALLVAAVTYGLLDSTGTFKNSTYNLGGAIVGFVVAAFYLNRIYGRESGDIPEDELKGASYISEDTVKVLDLRSQKPAPEEEKLTTPKNRVVLIDHYKLRKRTDVSEVKFDYATTGYGMEGISVSHAFAYKWTDVTEAPTGLGEDHHLRKQYEIELDVRDVARGEIIYVHNAVTYLNAFEGKKKEWFHTHADFPTRSVTIMLLFPESLRCKRIVGLQKVGRKDFEEVPKDKGIPVILEEGKLVYWRIANPRLGIAYQLEWDWDNFN